MVPGLWLEIEVMANHCSLADKVPEDWFFIRHGKRVIDNGRYPLDYRNAEVVAHADRVVASNPAAFEGISWPDCSFSVRKVWEAEAAVMAAFFSFRFLPLPR
jgi:hypothetical protein